MVSRSHAEESYHLVGEGRMMNMIGRIVRLKLISQIGDVAPSVCNGYDSIGVVCAFGDLFDGCF